MNDLNPKLNQQETKPAEGPVLKKAAPTTVATFSDARKSAVERREQENEKSLQALKSLVDMEKLASIISQAPEIDASRVVNLHHRIEAGEYEIDPARVAERLMALENSIDFPEERET